MSKLHPERLFVLRETKGLTQEGLAGMAELSDRQIRRLENAKAAGAPRTNNLSSSRKPTVAALAEVLETELDVITGEVPLPTSVVTLAETLAIDPDVLRLAESPLVDRDRLIARLPSPETPAGGGATDPPSPAQRFGTFIASSRASFRTMVSSLIGLTSDRHLGTLRLNPVVLATAGSMAVGAALAFATVILDTEISSRNRTATTEPVVGPPIRLEPGAGVGPHRKTAAPEFVPETRHAIFVPPGESDSASIADNDLSLLAALEILAELLVDTGQNDRALQVTDMLLRTVGNNTPKVLKLRERATSNLAMELGAALAEPWPTMESARSALERAERLAATGGEPRGLWLVRAKAHWMLGDYPSLAAALEQWLRASPESHPDRACIESIHSRANQAIVESRRFLEEIGHSPSPIRMAAGGWNDLQYASALNLPHVISALLIVDPTACTTRILPGYLDLRINRSVRELPDDARRILEARGGLPEDRGGLLIDEKNGRQLIDMGAFEEISTLAIAVMANSPEAAVELLKNGVDPDHIVRTTNSRVPVSDHSTPLYWAAALNRLDIAKLLLDHDASLHRGVEPPLVAAVRGNHLEMARLLLASGADPDEEGEGYYGNTVLFLAAQRNYLDMARLLIDHGADANQTYGVSAATPLWSATWGNHLEMVELLADRGAEFDESDMLLALSRRAFEVAEFLIRRGFDINTEYERFHSAHGPRITSGTVLHYVAANNDPTESVQFLINRGLDVDVRNRYNATPLAAAVLEENLEMAEFLIGEGADVMSSNKSGRTPLHLAAIRGNRAIVRLLIDRGAHPAARDDEGRTPADWARKAGYSSLADEILTMRASVEA